MLANSWNVRPGDWVECSDGRRGTVISTCSWANGVLLAVEIGFDWYGIDDLISWTPKH